MTTPPTIRSLRVRSVLAPMPRPLRTASGAIPQAPLVLIDVQTDQDVVGRAYVFCYTPLMLKPISTILNEIDGLIVGKPVAPADRFHDLSRTFRLLGRQGLVGMALSGLDMALWDALGRAANRPVVELLGGTAKPVPAYDSFGLVDPVADRAMLEQSIGAGFRAIKIKIGERCAAEDAAMVRAVRDIIGADIQLMVDLNQSQSATDAIRRIERLAAFDLTWVEEPVAAEDLEGHAHVRAMSPVPIQTGENWWFPSDMARAIAARACDMAMPDLIKIGGITGWLRAMALAEAASLPLSSHLLIEASAHALAVSPTCHFLEHLDMAGAVMAEPAPLAGGMITARGPGLGMAWNEDAIKRFEVA
jgi:mandelate racemase